MKNILLIVFFLVLTACQNHQDISSKENFNASTLNIQISRDTLQKDTSGVISSSPDVPLYIAQCAEPFMAAYFFKNKIRLIFPDRIDSVMNMEKGIEWNADFEGNYQSVNQLTLKLSIKNKFCIHPGSGENWEKSVTFVINNEEYKGCIKKLN